MAEWAYSLLLLNVLGLVASATGIAFVYMNLVATRQIGQNQTRAFVYAASATLDLPKREVAPTNALTGNVWIGPPPFVYLRIANLGQTPAVQVETVARLILAQAGKTSEVALELKEARSLDYVMKDAPQDLLFVLPADKLGAGARLSTVMKATNALMGGSMGEVEVTVAGTITYTDVFGDRIQTDFHFRRRDDTRGGKFDMFPIHGKSRMFRKVGRAK